MKIAIMGYVGSGKSVLARKLAEKYEIPKMELDEIAYDLHWRPIDLERILPDIKAFMNQESWIIDGNYDYLMQVERLEKADKIIFVLLPRMQCLIRALRRSKERKAAGYHNDINPKFLKFLLIDCRNMKRRAAYKQIMDQYVHKTVILKSQKGIDRFLKDELI